MTHPYLERTSPKGTDFVGTCRACGKTGIRGEDQFEHCDAEKSMTQEQALLSAIEGPSEETSK